jgi:N-acetylglucosaminyl-diphospho-decaprenol L-rhamnosyltransferase
MHDSAPSVSLLLPTRNRPDTLRQTLAAIGALPLVPMGRSAAHGCEVVIVDNASEAPTEAPAVLTNGVEVTRVRLRSNAGAAARNYGACIARGAWLLMLDDDSHPEDASYLECLADVPADVAAIGAAITLPSGAREAGGLPEVVIGCGALIRRELFLAVHGYDPAFQYYAEEYDLCAKFMHAGYRIAHDLRFRVLHEKTSAGRDMNAILRRLVRNNCWTLARHAPHDARDRAIEGTIERYREIAGRENAMQGFEAGLAELRATLDQQPRTPLSPEQYDRFTGLAAVRETLHAHPLLVAPTRLAIIEKGKHAWAVRQAVRELSAVQLVDNESDADVLLVGTLSPGPMLDAFERRVNDVKPVLVPWLVGAAPHTSKPARRAAQQLIARVR